jgi:hypothetical protein
MRRAAEPAAYDDLSPVIVVEMKIIPAELPIDAAAVFEEWMQKITAVKGCGARSVFCTRDSADCECWASASAGVGVLFGVERAR